MIDQKTFYKIYQSNDKCKWGLSNPLFIFSNILSLKFLKAILTSGIFFNTIYFNNGPSSFNALSYGSLYQDLIKIPLSG